MSRQVQEAKDRIRKKKNYFKQIGSFTATSIFLIGLNVFTSPGYMWAWWPIGMWGVSLLFQAVSLFVNDKAADWEQKEIGKELRKLGYDPEIYDDELNLRDTAEPIRTNSQPYRSSDLV